MPIPDAAVSTGLCSEGSLVAYERMVLDRKLAVHAGPCVERVEPLAHAWHQPCHQPHIPLTFLPLLSPGQLRGPGTQALKRLQQLPMFERCVGVETTELDMRGLPGERGVRIESWE